MLFDNCKGYATRDNAKKKLADTVKLWKDDIKKYIELNSMIVALPNGRFMPVVRMTGSPDHYRSDINSLIFAPGASIGVF